MSLGVLLDSRLCAREVPGVLRVILEVVCQSRVVSVACSVFCVVAGVIGGDLSTLRVA